jgi:hypothetical protein
MEGRTGRSDGAPTLVSVANAAPRAYRASSLSLAERAPFGDRAALHIGDRIGRQ